MNKLLSFLLITFSGSLLAQTTINLAPCTNCTGQDSIHKDHDWYDYAATNADPQSITNNIYTFGSVSWGNSTGVVGAGSLASGTHSMAGGVNNNVTASSALAIGNSNLVSGNNSISWGLENEVTSLYASAGGNNNHVLGGNSSVWGVNNILEATADRSSVWGLSNLVSSTDSGVWGALNAVSGLSSAAWGRRDTVSGNFSAAWGDLNSVTEALSSAMGGLRNRVAGSRSAIIGGSQNTIDANGSGVYEGLIAASRICVIDQISNGGSVILGSSNSNITGTGAGSYGANIILGGSQSIIDAGTTQRANNLIFGRRGNIIGHNGNVILADFGTLAVTSVANNAFTSRFAGGYRLFTNNATSAGVELTSGASSWTSISDKRAKNNIGHIQYGLATVMNLNPMIYTYNGNERQSLGFLAQDMKDVIPEIVDQTTFGEENDYLGIRYSELIPVLTKAIQEQQIEIDKLKTELSKVKKLENELSLLKEFVDKQRELNNDK